MQLYVKPSIVRPPEHGMQEPELLRTGARFVPLSLAQPLHAAACFHAHTSAS